MDQKDGYMLKKGNKIEGLEERTDESGNTSVRCAHLGCQIQQLWDIQVLEHRQ